MRNAIKVSALITGFPERLCQPKPLPGETRAQMVIRFHRQEWRNFTDRLRQTGVASDVVYAQLRQGILGSTGSEVSQRIEEFMNLRMPTHWRTMHQLAALRADSRRLGTQCLMSFELTEIIWPREKDPSGDTSAEILAERMGAKVIPWPTDAPRLMRLDHILSHLSGDYVWLLPGGTRIDSMMAAMSLERVMRYLSDSPMRSFYSDGADSLIYQVAALRNLADAGHPLPANSREMARLMQENGYEIAADDRPEAALCMLEEIYGGGYPFPYSSKATPDTIVRKPWWGSVFGR